MEQQSTPNIYKIVRAELDRRGIRWQQRHYNDIDIIAEIYAENYDPISIAKRKELLEREKDLETRENTLRKDEEIFELNRKKFEEQKSIFEKERDTVFQLSEQQKQFYAFAKSISNFYAVICNLRIPEFYVEQITSVLKTYIEEGKIL